MTKQHYQKSLSEFGETKSKETIDKVYSHIRACIKEVIEEEKIIKDFTNNTVVSSKIPERKDKEKHLNYIDSITLLNALHRKINDGLGLLHNFIITDFWDEICRIGEINSK